MKKSENLKKIWQKPSIQVLNIKKDTFGGSVVNTKESNPQKRGAKVG